MPQGGEQAAKRVRPRAGPARTPRARRAATAAVEPASGREGHPQNSVHAGQHYAASHGRRFPPSGTPLRPPAGAAVYYDKTLPFFLALHPGWQPLSRRAHATGSGHAPAGTAAGDGPAWRNRSWRRLTFEAEGHLAEAYDRAFLERIALYTPLASRRAAVVNVGPIGAAHVADDPAPALPAQLGMPP